MKILFVLLSLNFISLGFASDWVKEKKSFALKEYITLEGKKISNLKIGYETYGQLNAEKSNAILITHHFSGTSHAAGKYNLNDSDAGYWDQIIGPGKAIDTNKYFVIASDTLVNLTPYHPKTITTGPASINPKTKKPYALSFPFVALEDFVQVQKKLIEHLGVSKLAMVAGASGGAAQAMQWAASFPDSVERVLCVIGPGLKMPDYTVALLNLWSMPIKLDPVWKNGNYDSSKPPLKGVAESLKMITFSALSFEWAENFKREQENGSTLKDLNSRYKIEAFLDERAASRAKNVDANSLLYTAKAIQTFDIESKIDKIKARVLFIPVVSDLIFPANLSTEASRKLCEHKILSTSSELKTTGGHLDGLFKIQEKANEIIAFLDDKLEFCR